MISCGSKLLLSTSALPRDTSSASIHLPTFSPPAFLDSMPVNVTSAEQLDPIQSHWMTQTSWSLLPLGQPPIPQGSSETWWEVLWAFTGQLHWQRRQFAVLRLGSGWKSSYLLESWTICPLDVKQPHTPLWQGLQGTKRQSSSLSSLCQHLHELFPYIVGDKRFLGFNHNSSLFPPSDLLRDWGHRFRKYLKVPF